MSGKKLPAKGLAEKEAQHPSTHKRRIRERASAVIAGKNTQAKLESLLNQPITQVQRRAAVLQLQRIRGNAYVQRVLSNRFKQKTTQDRHLLVPLWGKVRGNNRGSSAGSIQRSRNERTVKSLRLPAWSVQRKTSRWGKGNKPLRRHQSSSMLNAGGMTVARKRIKKLKNLSRILRKLAQPVGSSKLMLRRTDESTAYSSWLGSASESTGSLASSWSTSLVSQAAGGSESSQFMCATRQMQEMNQSFNLQYLQLQQKMQAENRQFTMMSNIMKTKHDTAKNAINNIR